MATKGVIITNLLRTALLVLIVVLLGGCMESVHMPAATSYVGCSADAETWRGLRVCSERPRDGYDRDAFGTGYSRLEDDIIAALPSTMKAKRTGLYALLLHRIRYHAEWDRCD